MSYDPQHSVIIENLAALMLEKAKEAHACLQTDKQWLVHEIVSRHLNELRVGFQLIHEEEGQETPFIELFIDCLDNVID